ncbi:MAG: hypothetical protein K2K54_08175, partial [Lachnospiraceae bacterium]|nr:hypothetical protein [Lachnospiraceae bacterium]
MFHKINQFLEKKIIGKFEIDETALDEFCRENAKLWEKNNRKTASDGYIFIGLFMVEKWIPWLERKMLYAKGFEENTGKIPIVIDWEYHSGLEKFYASYGIRLLSLKKEMFGNIKGFFYGLWQAVLFWIFDGTGKGIIRKKYKDVNAGSFMYDTIIRTNQDIYTIRKARNKICFKKVLTSYWFLDSLNRVCKKCPPAYYIFDDVVYDEGMIAEYMRRRGGTVVNCTIDGRLQLPDYTEGTIYWPDFDKYVMEQSLRAMSKEEEESAVRQAETALKERFLGRNG